MQDEVVLELRGVTKVFGEGPAEVVALRDIHLQVKRGELLLIMGPSGSGKTTLLTIAGALLRPTAGSVLVKGTELSALSEGGLSQLRQESIGFVFQSFNLLAALTALENVAVALEFAGRKDQHDRQAAQKLLQDFGLGARLRFRPENLSGGEKQRVSIARALVKDPDVVLADEPTANLDSQRGHEIVELLKMIARDRRKAVVVVSHDHRIRELADRVLWLEDGQLHELEIHRDPVCGMEIDPSQARDAWAYQGRTYYFCAEGCRLLFQEDPTRYLGRDGEG